MKTQTRKTIQISHPFFADEEKQAIAEVMDTGWVTQGPKVRAFEEAFAAAHHAPHAVAVTSCTTGLFLALAAWDLGPGDEVIIPAFTWVTTGNVVVSRGATPVFVDVERENFNLDVAQVAAKVTGRTKAIIPVHLFGLCADIDALRAAIPPHVKILEDAACGAGATLRGRHAGTLGEAGVFSFHPRKIITTGEGGIITTDDDEYAEQLRRLRNHGASVPEEIRHAGPRPYSLPEFNELGYNFRMTDFQGAIGLPQVARLPRLVEERRIMAARYDAELADVPWLRTPLVPEGFGHGWQAYVCFVEPDRAPHDRNRIMEILQDEWQISTRPGTHALHMLGYYRERFGLSDDDFPAARDCHHQAMALPLHNCMSDEDQSRIIDAVHALG